MGERLIHPLQNIRQEIVQTWSDLTFRYHDNEFQRELNSIPSQRLMDLLGHFQTRGNENHSWQDASLTLITYSAGIALGLTLADKELARNFPWTAIVGTAALVAMGSLLWGTVAANCERRARYIQNEMARRLASG